VTVDARAGLSDYILAFGECLIVKHVRVTPFLAKIDGKRIPVPHRLQTRVLLESRLSDDRTRIGGGRCAVRSLAAAVARALLIDRAQVTVVLERKILAPDRRIVDIVGKIDDAEKRILGFLFPLHDVCQKRKPGDRAEERDEGGDDNDLHAIASRPARFFWGRLIVVRNIGVFFFSHSACAP
jgi:hypothetical protein